MKREMRMSLTVDALDYENEVFQVSQTMYLDFMKIGGSQLLIGI